MSEYLVQRSESQPSINITYQTSNGNFEDLQEFINDRLIVENEVYRCNNCTGTKSITPVLPYMHIIIEILYWNCLKLPIYHYFIQYYLSIYLYTYR